MSRIHAQRADAAVEERCQCIASMPEMHGLLRRIEQVELLDHRLLRRRGRLEGVHLRTGGEDDHLRRILDAKRIARRSRWNRRPARRCSRSRSFRFGNSASAAGLNAKEGGVGLDATRRASRSARAVPSNNRRFVFPRPFSTRRSSRNQTTTASTVWLHALPIRPGKVPVVVLEVEVPRHHQLAERMRADGPCAGHLCAR